MATTIESETAYIDFKEFVGDTLHIQLSYANAETLVPYNLLSSIVSFEIWNKVTLIKLYDFKSTDVGSYVVTTGLVYNIDILLPDTLTTTLGVGTFNSYIKVVDSGGLVNTLVSGKLKLVGRV